MTSCFEDKSAKILIIESFSAIRQVLSEQLKKFGFASINGVANPKDALGILEVEVIDWILCPTNIDSPENCIQLLSLISSRSVLKKTRVTMFLDEEELELIPFLYEKGLFSHMIKPLNKVIIQENIENLMKELSDVQWDDVKFSSNNLRKYLETNKNYRSLIQLEKGLLNIYPGECEYLLRLASYSEKIGETEKAKNLLLQVKMIDPSQEEEVNKIYKNIFGEEPSKDASITSDVNILGINNSVIIDPDDLVRRDMKKILSEFGIKNIQEFERGDEAWNWIKEHEEPDLIIQEWRVPKLSGPVLLQRIRDKFPASPVILLSSLITDADKPLIHELGVESIHSKPIMLEEFKKSLIFFKQQERLPSDASILERKIKQFLKAGKISEAIKIKDQFLSSKTISEADKKRINAQFLYFKGYYIEARNLAIEAAKADPESLYLLNFIGKCLMKLKDYQSAVLCFKKAQAISPQNVERLCEMASASFETGDEEGSEEALKDGQKIDENNEKLLGTEAGIRIQKGEKKKAMELLGKMDSVNEIVSYMNNKAVAFTKNGMIEEGIDLYEKTIDSLPESKLETRSLVMYNNALALAKDGKLEKAKEVLEEIIKLSPKKIIRKSHSLKLRIDRCIEKGESLSFITDTKDSQEKNSEHSVDTKVEESSSVVGYIQTSPGDVCCYKVFINPEEPTDKWKSIDISIPRFTARESIEKDESTGLEKMLKTS